ncbi:AlpA family transcriptional regulator [Rhodoferax lacus]|uniref:AlpA family transcriptional regulator n=1 Tax=Rhodoferax lacus TaxID=2184758 RepID=A0A3E1RGC2_9BURK|nr:AlpA family phage regulatory protein [Rhodoferax lacus]RFO98291.1 AlpA family transcriptional regulator [Rhodoferax lacus]
MNIKKASANPRQPVRVSPHGNFNFDELPDTGFMRQPKVLEVVPFSSATLWRHCKNGQFPKPVKLSERVTAWNVGLIRQWLLAQADKGEAV